MLIIVETLVFKKLFKHMAKLWKLGLLSMAVQRL